MGGWRRQTWQLTCDRRCCPGNDCRQLPSSYIHLHLIFVCKSLFMFATRNKFDPHSLPRVEPPVLAVDCSVVLLSFKDINSSQVETEVRKDIHILYDADWPAGGFTTCEPGHMAPGASM